MSLSKRVFLKASAFVLAGIGRIVPARADPQTQAALGVVDAWYLPHVEALASASAAQRTAWEEGCRADPTDVERLRSAFQAASDAWVAIEHAGFGPLGERERSDRIAFFPDKRNAVARGVGELLRRAEKGSLTAAQIAQFSVAGQGLPALERLLYDPALAKSFETAQRAQARCMLGLAIAENLSDIAAEVKAEWQAPNGPRAKLAAGEGSPPAFADGRQALARMLTDLATGLQRLVDLKMRRFLGAAADTATPLLAEGYRSDRVKRNLALAAQSLAEEAKALAASTPELVRDRVNRVADRFAQHYAAMPEDVAQRSADPQRRGEVIDLIASLRAMQTVMAAELGPALGVQLGFNALDGD